MSEVQKAIKDLKAGKATGPDQIATEMLKSEKNTCPGEEEI